jgi:hypothetical protein
MSADRLRQILQQADATAGAAPEMPGDLAQRVRVRASRRRRVRVGLGAAAVLVLAVGATWFWPRRSTTPRSSDQSRSVVAEPPEPDVAQLKVELERLRRDAEMRLAVIHRTEEILEELKHFDALRNQPPPPDAVANTRRQVDHAAYVLVSQADRMCRELNLCDSAAVRYRRVVDLFPESRWAVVARQRLSELESKGDVS